MCTVYEFPKQFKMPKDVEERLQSMADEYVELMTDAFDYFIDEDTTIDEYEKIFGLILTTYLNCIDKAMNKTDF